jgi:surface protein
MFNIPSFSGFKFSHSSPSVEPFIFTVNTSLTGQSASNQFFMPLASSVDLNIDIDWGDGTPIQNVTLNTDAQHTYASAGIYTISVTGSLVNWRFNNTGDRTKMLNISQWGCFNMNLEAAFYGCSNMNSTATDYPIITSTNLNGCFRGCTIFNGAINNWNVSIVQNFGNFFRDALAFNQNIGGWNTSSATAMTSMFQNATAFNQNIGSWNTINVTNMNNMFNAAIAFNQSISLWDVFNVTNMGSMFSGATAFNQNIGSWQIQNVTNFSNFMRFKTFNDYSASNLDSIYNNWSDIFVQPNVSINFQTIKYTASAQAGKNILTGSPNNWVIVDGGTV